MQSLTQLLRHWASRKSLVLVILIIGLATYSASVNAQSAAVIWSTPENLSNALPSWHPTIIADTYGNVHVFWSEDIDSPQRTEGTGNAIYYTRWDGNTWTQPVDVLLVPDDTLADFISVALDKNGYLHAVWTGLRNIYYSNAPVLEAGSADAWSKPVVISTESARSSWESSIAVDSVGHIHIIYSTRGNDPRVFHVQSADGGKTWSETQPLSEPFDSLETSLARLKLITDSAGRLHAVWQTAEVDGYGQAIYYARSTNNGSTWSSPQQMAYRHPGDFDVGWPYIMEGAKSDLHMIYNGGATVGAAGRYERVSTDGGETWSEPQLIIPDMIGINGYVVPVVDGAGQLHLIINMRPLSTQQVGIYYSSWLGDQWSPVVPLVVGSAAADTAHYTAAAVAHGNEIHIVWTQLHSGEIWHLRGVVQNLPAAPNQPTPSITTTAVVKMEATAVPTFSSTIVPLPVQVNTTIPSPINTMDISPIVPGALGTLLVITLAAVLIYVRKRI